ncbi:MAG: 3-deoxy-manno-octulosonate cytidylyltransferase [Pseudomonadota bacterium]
MSVLIVIPARMKATRLPGKPLASIGGVPMIVQVMRRALESGVGEVVVACDGAEIADAVRAAGGQAIVTDPDHPSGSDRIWEAVRAWPTVADTIINLQGDVPTLDPQNLRDVLLPLANPAVDIATLVTPITRAEEHENPSVVKAVIALNDNDNIGRALYFTRATAPYGEGVRYHHIGVYAYRRAALERFVSLPPSPLELREKLEQLRALEAGMRIDGCVVNTVPLGVDTPEDLQRAREILGGA